MVQIFKVYLIGAMGTGKTSFLKYHTTGTFPKYYVSTMGIGIDTKTINVDEKEYILKFFDLNPEVQMYGDFDNNLMYSQDPIDNSGYDHTFALAFYDLSKESQMCTNMIIKKFKKICANVPIINVLNKIDLSSDHASVPIINVLNKIDLSSDCVGSTHEISLFNGINCSEPLFDAIRIFESLNHES